jgi:hypothetical protein
MNFVERGNGDNALNNGLEKKKVPEKRKSVILSEALKAPEADISAILAEGKLSTLYRKDADEILAVFDALLAKSISDETIVSELKLDLLAKDHPTSFFTLVVLLHEKNITISSDLLKKAINTSSCSSTDKNLIQFIAINLGCIFKASKQ